MPGIMKKLLITQRMLCMQIYLSGASMETSITTAKSSALNVLFPDSDGGDMKEQYIPEQFVSRLVNGALRIEPVAHGGG